MKLPVNSPHSQVVRRSHGRVSLKHDGTDGTDGTAKQTGHRRRPVCPVGDGTAKTDGTAVVEAKWDTNRNLTVVTHVVRLHV